METESSYVQEVKCSQVAPLSQYSVYSPGFVSKAGDIMDNQKAQCDPQEWFEFK